MKVLSFMNEDELDKEDSKVYQFISMICTKIPIKKKYIDRNMPIERDSIIEYSIVI